MFLIDIPFKGCQGRSNRSSILHAVSMTPHAYVHAVSMTPHAYVHAVSMTAHAFFIFFAYHRCFAYNFHFSKLFETFFVHTVSMTQHAPCMRYQCHRMHHAFKKIRISLRIRIYIRKGCIPLIRSPGRMF
jgi:hypothetical protein